MFKRRVPLSRMALVKELFWPSMGWKRAFYYVKHRIIRLSGSSESISRGLATGACISFTPLVGTHFIQAGLLAYIIRGNLLASLIGTFVGNPWTFPFMWFAAYTVGVKIFGLFGFSDFASLPDHVTLSILWDMVLAEPLKLFLPWLVGGYSVALFSWPIFFVIFYFLVRGAKRAKALAKANRLRQQSIERHKFMAPPQSEL